MDNTKTNEGALFKIIIGLILIIIGTVILLFLFACITNCKQDEGFVVMALLLGGVFLGVGINFLTKGLGRLNQSNEKK